MSGGSSPARRSLAGRGGGLARLRVVTTRHIPIDTVDLAPYQSYPQLPTEGTLALARDLIDATLQVPSTRVEKLKQRLTQRVEELGEMLARRVEGAGPTLLQGPRGVGRKFRFPGDQRDSSSV